MKNVLLVLATAIAQQQDAPSFGNLYITEQSIARSAANETLVFVNCNASNCPECSTCPLPLDASGFDDCLARLPVTCNVPAMVIHQGPRPIAMHCGLPGVGWMLLLPIFVSNVTTITATVQFPVSALQTGCVPFPTRGGMAGSEEYSDCRINEYNLVDLNPTGNPGPLHITLDPIFEATLGNNQAFVPWIKVLTSCALRSEEVTLVQLSYTATFLGMQPLPTTTTTTTTTTTLTGDTQLTASDGTTASESDQVLSAFGTILWALPVLHIYTLLADDRAI